MRYLQILVTLLAVVLFSFTPVKEENQSFDGAWKFIADKNVGWGVDHDVIHTGNIRDDFRQLKLRVTEGPLKMYDMKIHFDNGDVQDVQIRKILRKGTESRIIDLAGGLRHIAKIEFWYETKGYSRGRARISVWGRK